MHCSALLAAGIASPLLCAHTAIVYDVPMLGRREANTLVININGRTVMHAVIPSDESPPLFLDYHPDAAWRRAIRRAHVTV